MGRKLVLCVQLLSCVYYNPLINKYDHFSNRSKVCDFARTYSSFRGPTTSPDLFRNRVYERSEFVVHQGRTFLAFVLSFWFRVVLLIKITKGVSAVFLYRIF